MHCETALITYLVVFIILLILTKAWGLTYRSSIALAALISIFVLTFMKPLNATNMIKTDGYTQVYAVIYIATSIYLLWYILICACNDWDENCFPENCFPNSCDTVC